MSSKPIKIPGPDHPITIKPSNEHIVIRTGGKVLADTRSSLVLAEASYPEVHYIPRSDVDMTLLRRSDHATYCPYKGDATYYTIDLSGPRGVDAVWTYEAPYAAVCDIKDYLAFYPDRVDSIQKVAD
jgi:uncharacterized protein (DUF427 family)